MRVENLQVEKSSARSQKIGLERPTTLSVKKSFDRVFSSPWLPHITRQIVHPNGTDAEVLRIRVYDPGYQPEIDINNFKVAPKVGQFILFDAVGDPSKDLELTSDRSSLGKRTKFISQEAHCIGVARISMAGRRFYLAETHYPNTKNRGKQREVYKFAPYINLLNVTFPEEYDQMVFDVGEADDQDALDIISDLQNDLERVHQTGLHLQPYSPRDKSYNGGGGFTHPFFQEFERSIFLPKPRRKVMHYRPEREPE